MTNFIKSMRSWLILPCLTLQLFLAGCSEAPTGPPTDDKSLVEILVSELPDRALQPEMWKMVFVDGAAPENAEDYVVLQLEATQVSISGTTATAQVAITRQKATGEPPVVTWELEKTADKTWQVVKAPLE